MSVPGKMAFPTPPGPHNPIPNNPFYYRQTNFIQGDIGPFIVGAGLVVNSITGEITLSGGPGGAVATITAGPGIYASQNTGNITLANTGVISITPGPGISITGTAGNYTITNTSPASTPTGTVTQINTGAGLTGGPIVSSGTVSLETVSTVAPGTYTNATVRVDEYGRVTYAAPGPPAGGFLLEAVAPLQVNASWPQTVEILPASTSALGAVKLNSSVSSTSTTEAATPSAVKCAYDSAAAAVASASTALSNSASAITASSAAQTTATNALGTATSAQNAANTAFTTATTAAASATAAQATASAAIPCACFGAKGHLLVGTGGSTLVSLSPGLNGQILTACNSTVTGLTWTSLPIADGTVTSIATGPGLSGGPVTTTGAICLAPSGVTPSTYTYATVTVDTYGRVLTASAGAPPIPCSAITSKGAILTGTAPGSVTALPAGLNGRVLTTCSSCPTGLTWSDYTPYAIPCSCITGKGALVTGTSAGSPTSLAAGANGLVLTTDSSCPAGLKWAVAASPIYPATPTVAGSVYGLTKTSITYNTALGHQALNTTATGVGNLALGASAGNSLISGQFNTLVGAGAGCDITDGTNNIGIGSQTLFALTNGTNNTAIGNQAGSALTVELNNVILGPHPGIPAKSNQVLIASGAGNLRLHVNETGAYDFGGVGFGNVGQVLTSSGPGAPPSWISPSACNGTVSCIITGTGLSGGPITTSGTICLADTTVIPGCYTNSTISVDAQGRLLAASSGTAPITALSGSAPIAITSGTTPTVSICPASTASCGAVQLYDGVNSTSTALALTAAQGKALQDQIDTLTNSGGLELAGTLNALSGVVASVTSIGVSAGYAVSSPLPAADASTNKTYVIVTTAGNFTPPGGTAVDATQGDWFTVTETSPGVYAWSYLNVGYDPVYATTTTCGVVCFADNAQGQAGLSSITALTPASAEAGFIAKRCVTAKGDLIAGTGTNTLTALAVGAEGYALTACTICPTGLTWTDLTVPMACATVAGKVFGFTGGTGGPTFLGYCAGAVNSDNGSVGIGAFSLKSQTVGLNNTVVGHCAMDANISGCGNAALGFCALGKSLCSNNVAVGCLAASCTTTGCNNVALGTLALQNNTTGCNNVAIGYCAQVPAGSCQLSIGYAQDCYWLTGDSNKNIRPGAGVIDCAASVGTNGQVLTSTGSQIAWSGAVYFSATVVTSASIVVDPTSTGSLMSFGVEVADPLNFYDPTTSRFQPTIPGLYQVSASLMLNTTGGQMIQARLVKNGSTLVGVSQASNGGNAPQAIVSRSVYMNGSSDFVEVYGATTTPGLTLLTSAGVGQTANYFEANLVR